MSQPRPIKATTAAITSPDVDRFNEPGARLQHLELQACYPFAATCLWTELRQKIDLVQEAGRRIIAARRGVAALQDLSLSLQRAGEDWAALPPSLSPTASVFASIATLRARQRYGDAGFGLELPAPPLLLVLECAAVTGTVNEASRQ